MRSLTLTMTALAAVAALPVATATAAKPHASKVEVHGKGGPGMGYYGFRVDISASKAAGQASKGTFRGTIAPGTDAMSTPDLVTIDGPVTCLTVVGRSAGVLYPVRKATTPAGAQSGEPMSILVTVTQGVNGAPSMMGFEGPLPTQAFLGACAPGLTPLALTGTVRVTA